MLGIYRLGDFDSGLQQLVKEGKLRTEDTRPLDLILITKPKHITFIGYLDIDYFGEAPRISRERHFRIKDRPETARGKQDFLLPLHQSIVMIEHRETALVCLDPSRIHEILPILRECPKARINYNRVARNLGLKTS